MEYLEREVFLYVGRVVEERFGNDPTNRLNAFRNVTTYFANNRSCTASQRYAMLRHVFGDHNQDLIQVVYTLLQDEYDDILLQSPPQVRYAKLLKVAKMCWCTQFMNLFRQRFSIHAPSYSTLSNVVHLFSIDQVPESQLVAYLSQVLLLFPGFRDQLEARVNQLTPLFNIGGGNPPPQV